MKSLPSTIISSCSRHTSGFNLFSSRGYEQVKTYIALIIATIILFSFGVFAQKKAKPVQKPVAAVAVSYKKDVRPILIKYCLPCHSEEEMNPSELYFESYQQTIEGGKHGPPIVPGKADSSLLIQKLSADPPFGKTMPIKQKPPVPPDSVTILKTWINQGAKNN